LGKALDVAMRARYKGQQFLVSVKMIKGQHAVIRSPTRLQPGEPLLLQSASPDRELTQLQLSGRVEKDDGTGANFLVALDRLVSPRGAAALVRFMDVQFGLNVAFPEALQDQIASAGTELAFYQFSDRSLHVPASGLAITKDSLRTGRSGESPAGGTQLPSPSGLDNLRPPAGPIGPAPDRLPVNGQQAPRAAARPIRTETSPEEKAGTIEEHGDYIEMFGMKVSRENWERLENLNYKSTSLQDKAPVRKKPSPAAREPRGGPQDGPLPRPGSSPGSALPPKPKGGVSSLLRKLASKLAAEETGD
jgi:hypothetical protein